MWSQSATGPRCCIGFAARQQKKTTFIVGKELRFPRLLQGRSRSAASLHAREENPVTPLGYLLLLIPATTFGLGCWQVKRKIWKEQLLKDMQKLATMEAQPLPDDLDNLVSMEYHRVKMRGRFINDRELYLGPRTLIHQKGDVTATSADGGGGLFSQRNKDTGYLVITPFKLHGRDDTILVNRGWVPRNQLSPESRRQGQCERDVVLTGVIRKAESRPQFAPDHTGKGVFLYRDIAKMCAQVEASPVFVDATFESTIPGGPIGGQTRINLPNDHLSYLITWFSLSAATMYLWYHKILKGRHH